MINVLAGEALPAHRHARHGESRDEDRVFEADFVWIGGGSFRQVEIGRKGLELAEPAVGDVAVNLVWGHGNSIQHQKIDQMNMHGMEVRGQVDKRPNFDVSQMRRFRRRILEIAQIKQSVDVCVGGERAAKKLAICPAIVIKTKVQSDDAVHDRFTAQGGGGHEIGGENCWNRAGVQTRDVGGDSKLHHFEKSVWRHRNIEVVGHHDVGVAGVGGEIEDDVRAFRRTESKVRELNRSGKEAGVGADLNKGLAGG